MAKTVSAVQIRNSAGAAFRKVFQLLQPDVLEERFLSRVASLQDIACGMIAIDGRTLRGSEKSAVGSGALHLLSAYACAAAVVTGQRAVDGKNNESKAVPELLDMLAGNGAIASIAWRHKSDCGENRCAGADYTLALKGNQARSTMTSKGSSRQGTGRKLRPSQND